MSVDDWLLINHLATQPTKKPTIEQETTVGESKNDRFQEQSPLTLTKIIKNRKKHLEMYFHISKSLFGD